jgi:hypothetical protein
MLEHLESHSDQRVKLEWIRRSAGKTSAFAYFVGVYLGDGWMGNAGRNYRFRLNTIDMDFAESTANAIEMMTGIKPTIFSHSVTKSNKLNHSICITMRDWSWVVDSCEKKSLIPDYIWDMPRAAKLAFVAGIMDSEGYCGKGTRGRLTIGLKACDKWIMDFHRFMSNLGVVIGKIGHETLPSNKVAIRYHFPVDSFVKNGCYFTIQRKQKRIVEKLSNPQRPYVSRIGEDMARPADESCGVTQ